MNFCCHDLEALDKSNPLAEALMTMLSSFLKFLLAFEGEVRGSGRVDFLINLKGGGEEFLLGLGGGVDVTIRNHSMKSS